MEVVITKSSRKDETEIDAMINGKNKISFGQAGYSDFTRHRDPTRRQNYISRNSQEDWSKSNIASPAWMSRYIVWENLL